MVEAQRDCLWVYVSLHPYKFWLNKYEVMSLSGYGMSRPGQWDNLQDDGTAGVEGGGSGCNRKKFHSAVSPYRFKMDKNVASRFGLVVIDDLRKSRGLHSVSAYRHGLYIQVHACGCSAE